MTPDMPDLLKRFNNWLERRISPSWWRRIDAFNRWTLTFWVVLFAIVGAAIAGWALTRGIWGVVFAIPVALGAWLLLREWRP